MAHKIVQNIIIREANIPAGRMIDGNGMREDDLYAVN